MMSDSQNALVVIPVRCTSGESLCKRCGTVVDSFLEHDRKRVIGLVKQNSTFKDGFMDRSNLYDLGEGANAFKPRKVCNNMVAGLEIPFPVVCVLVDWLEKKRGLSIDKMGIPYETCYNNRGDAALRVVVLDPSDEIPSDVPYLEGKLFFRSEAVLSEMILKPGQQLHGNHALETWSWQAAQNDNKRNQLSFKQVAGQSSKLLTWAKIDADITAAKKVLELKELQLSRGADAGGSGAVAPTKRIQLISGSNMRDAPHLLTAGGAAAAKAAAKAKSAAVSAGKARGVGGGKGSGKWRAGALQFQAVPKSSPAQPPRTPSVVGGATADSVLDCGSSGEDSNDGADSARTLLRDKDKRERSSYKHKDLELNSYFNGSKPGSITIPDLPARIH
jgi:hypothetical protein